MIEIEFLEKELKSINKSYSIIFFDSIDSTNSYLLRESFPAGTIVVADTQTAGRGRQYRKWESNDSGNLYFSFVIEDIEPKRLFNLNIVAAFSICDVLFEKWGVQAKVKWPNDVVVYGKKIAGILIETVMSGKILEKAVMGIGINLNGKVFSEEVKKKAISLQEIIGIKVKKEDFLLEFFAKFESWKGKIDKVSANWYKYSAHINNEISFHGNNGIEKFVEKGINEDGALIVVDGFGREKTVFFGEIGYDISY